MQILKKRLRKAKTIDLHLHADLMIVTSIQVATVLRTALCESIRYQAKSEQNVRQDLIPRVLHGEAALMHPSAWGVRCEQTLGHPALYFFFFLLIFFAGCPNAC